jgi:hypothetical protein
MKELLEAILIVVTLVSFTGIMGYTLIDLYNRIKNK